MRPWLLLAPVLVLAACGGTQASCTICEASFSDAQCQQLAIQNGCTTGVAYQDTECSPPTQGCQFDGCGVGPVACDIGSSDTGL